MAHVEASRCDARHTTHPPAAAPLATGAIAQALSLPTAFAAFALALVTTAAAVAVIACLSRARATPRKA
jgi:hypothetical protein